MSPTPYPPAGPPVPDPGPTFKGSAVRHGTQSGWRFHQSLGEDPCDTCRAAKARYDWVRSNSGETQIRNRLHAKAQSLVSQDLRREHSAEYAALYTTHCQDLFREADLAYTPKKAAR